MARVGGKNPADLIAGYRGGYTPLERKEIERKMTEGELTGLVSTNALELGIDIGKLDATVIVGYPGTRASFWQQSGRAGRSGSACVNYLILEMNRLTSTLPSIRNGCSQEKVKMRSWIRTIF